MRQPVSARNCVIAIAAGQIPCGAPWRGAAPSAGIFVITQPTLAPAIGNVAENANGFLARLLRCPGRTVSADLVPALAAFRNAKALLSRGRGRRFKSSHSDN
jgi:hypothetical protein